jgi:hypothetical protein
MREQDPLNDGATKLMRPRPEAQQRQTTQGEEQAESTEQALLTQRLQQQYGHDVVSGALSGEDTSAMGTLVLAEWALGSSGLDSLVDGPTGSSNAVFGILHSDEWAASSAATLSRHETSNQPGHAHLAADLIRRSRGQRLPTEVAARLSAALGTDISNAVIHTDSAAAQAAAAVNAHAFATGRDVFFGAGEYKPGTREGDELLAHELTHVVQDSEGRIPQASGEGLTVSSPSDSHEREAESAGREAMDVLHGAGEVELTGMEGPAGEQTEALATTGPASLLSRDEDEAVQTLLGTDEAPDNLTPGMIYSNTTRSRLEKDDDAVEEWQRQGYEHSKKYKMSGLTLSHLAWMGKYKRLSTPEGRLEGGEDISRTTDVIESPNGAIESKSTRDSSTSVPFVLRGGATVGEPTVDLTVANNGCLNLVRLAIATWEMCQSWGLDFKKGTRTLDYKGGNYEVVCDMTMNNEVEDDHGRDHGFVAALPVDLDKRVGNTISFICAAAVLHADGREPVQARGKDLNTYATKNTSGQVAFHPLDTLAPTFREGDKAYKKPKEGETMKWVQGDEIGARAQKRISGAWIDRRTDVDTLFKTVPDFSEELNGLHVRYEDGEKDLKSEEVQKIAAIVRDFAKLLTAKDDNFDSHILGLDKDTRAKYLAHYRKVITKAFETQIQGGRIWTELEDLQTSNANWRPGTTGASPSKGDTQHDEGKVRQ